MTKRKASSKKSTKAKVAKLEDNVLNETEKSDNEPKLDEFKNKLRIPKGDDEDAKNWISGDSYLIYNPTELEPSVKIAAFDIDSTLIVTKSGKKFPQAWNDFKIMLDEIPGKMKSLKNDGYKLVIFTNQAGFVSGYVKESDFKKKMADLLEILGVTMQIFIATDKSAHYRKPNTGLFDLLLDKYNGNVKVDLNESFYVGDAAGRPDNWAPNKKKDFSCSDRLFALNCGIKFHTPEEFFLNEPPAPYNLPTFNPSAALANNTQLTIKYDNLTKTTTGLSDVLPSDSTEPVLIILVGSPGSGKSHFAATYLVPLGYNVINRDTLKTWQKCVAATEKLLKEKKKVVIDNTNPDEMSRERYVSCALKNGVSNILCFVLDVSTDQSRHNGKYRELTDKDHEKISEMVFRMYSSKYKEPGMEEKFTAICKIVPGFSFGNEENKKLYAMYLNDK